MDNPTRQQIIEATSTLLERQGYHATGLKQIVDASGAPRGSLYYYFPDGKEEMAAAAVTRKAELMAEHTRAHLAEIDDPVDAIVEFVAHLAEQYQCENFCGGAPLVAVALETSETNAHLRTTCAHAYTMLHRPFVEKLEAGGFAPARAAQLTVFISAALEGAIILARTQRSAVPIEAVAQELQAALRHAQTSIPTAE